MEFVTIPGTTLRISRIGLGTWSIGGSMWGGSDETDAIRTIGRALERGINLIDTAPVYGFGRAEAIVGKALAEAGQRDHVTIATKVGLEWDERGNIFRNSSPSRIEVAIEESLRRLRTDVVDIYQIHWPDAAIPIDETARVLQRLHQQGKIRAIGVSNFSPSQMDAFRATAPLHTNQPPYNLFEREIEADVLPYCRINNITTLTYGAICRGLLSGRMKPETKFASDDIRNFDPKFRPPLYQAYLRTVERLDRLAQERHGRRVIHLAVRWLLDQPGVGAALWGARRPEQLDALENVFGWTIDEATQRAIDNILSEEVGYTIGAEFMAPP